MIKRPFDRLSALVLLSVGLAAAYGAKSTGDTPPEPAQYKARVERVYERPHAGFTQGLVYHDGRLYESTGLYGQSTVTVYDFEDYSLVARIEMDKNYFGEGLALAGGALVQLTWREQIGFVYDADTLERRGRFEYQGEGWGLTYDGTHLIMSNGSDELYWRDPVGYGIERRVAVRHGGRPVGYLNELEYIDGRVYANVWRTDRIVIIDPETGHVAGEIDLRPIADRYRDKGKEVGVLNGIAWDSENERLFITGKHWPHLYHISLERTGPPD